MNLINYQLIDYSKRYCIVCIPAYNFGNYVHFKNNKDQPRSHHIVCILNQVPDIYIISTLNFMEETLVSFPKLFVKICLNHGWMKISKLFLSYQTLVYGTNMKKNVTNVEWKRGPEKCFELCWFNHNLQCHKAISWIEYQYCKRRYYFQYLIRFNIL